MGLRRGRGASRGWRLLRRVVAALIAIWVVVGYLLIVNPGVDRPGPVDAILVLGPSLQPRLDLAVSLANRFHIRDLAISVGDTPGQAHGGLCGQAPPGLRVTCFKPAPYTTRGEARELRTLSAQRGWHSVIVIAPTPQLSRARLLMQRCYHGTLRMVASPHEFGLSGWIYQFLYQSAALVETVVQRGC